MQLFIVKVWFSLPGGASQEPTVCAQSCPGRAPASALGRAAISVSSGMTLRLLWVHSALLRPLGESVRLP